MLNAHARMVTKKAMENAISAASTELNMDHHREAVDLKKNVYVTLQI